VYPLQQRLIGRRLYCQWRRSRAKQRRWCRRRMAAAEHMLLAISQGFTIGSHCPGTLSSKLKSKEIEAKDANPQQRK